MHSRRIRLGGRCYMFCATYERAPEQGRRLSSRQLQRLLAEQGTHPLLRRLVAELNERRMGRQHHATGHPGLDALMRLACYELPVPAPRVSTRRLPDPLELPVPEQAQSQWLLDEPRHTPPPAPKPVHEPSQAGQAATLRAAAQTATPFCEICRCLA